MIDTDVLAAGMLSLPVGISTTTVILVVFGAFGAGFVDAVVGGGGLIQLPALLLVPGIAPVQALATNKLASIAGTATAGVTYYRKLRTPLGVSLPMAGIALVSSIGGAFLAVALPAAAIKPIIVLALIVVAAVTLLRPEMGREAVARHPGVTAVLLGLMLGGAVGLYDGFIGPGTGTFLILGMVTLLGYDFLRASAQAKIVNTATNLGALLLFIPAGVVLWGLGLLMAAANVAGSLVGSRLAMAKGNRFVRTVFLIVVIALILKLGIDVWQENLQALWRN